MPDETEQPTQKTQPKGKDKTGKPYGPAKIPVPTRKAVEDLMRSVIGRPKSRDAE